jgi:hypothetical protein
MEQVSPILEYLGVEVPSDEEVWSQARKSEDLPNFENILIEMSFNRLESAIRETYPDVSDDMDFEAFVNAADSSFSVNGKPFTGGLTHGIKALEQIVTELREDDDFTPAM